MSQQRPARQQQRPAVPLRPRAPAKPSANMLVLLNAVALLVLCTYSAGGNPLALLLSVVFWLLLIVVSALFQSGVFFLDRKRGLPSPALRIGLYLLPSLLLAGWTVLGPYAPELLNQRSVSVSPSGAYLLRVGVPIQTGRWRVTISNRRQGRVLLQDDTDFLGQLSVYWCWDSTDRVWLYNSDDGEVYFWESAAGRWMRSNWGYGRTKQIRRPLFPPEALYPDYEK